MEKESLIPVSATTKPTNQKESLVKHSNKFSWDRSLVDQLGKESMMATYGSGSLDATSSTTTTTRQDVEDCHSDGILKNPSEDQEGDKNNDNEADALESRDSPYVYYFGGNSNGSTWKTYLGSWRFVELLVCVVPCLAVFLYYEVSNVKPRIRPIPVQQIYTIDGGEIRSNDYSSSSSNGSEGYSSHTNLIWNPVNTESWSGDTVGHRQSQILFGLCPWLLQVLLVWYLARARKRLRTDNSNSFCFWDALHRTTCMYFVGIGITDGLTNCIKYYVGYLRPIFLERCQPYYDETDSTVKCSIRNSHTFDARVSFPSNHSAWSFCGMMLLCMYLERTFGLSSLHRKSTSTSTSGNSSSIQKRDQQALYRLISLMCYAPMLLACFVAASRVVDNKHFPADVVGGALLGGSVASLVFGIWFPNQTNDGVW